MRSKKHNSNTKSSRQPTVEPIVEKVQLPPMLRPHCGIWAEPGRVEIMFRLDPEGSSYQHIVVEVPPKDGSLPVVRGQGAEAVSIYVGLPQAARLCGYKPKTFYNWVEAGKLSDKHGLRRVGRDCRFEWRILKGCIDRGELSSCS